MRTYRQAAYRQAVFLFRLIAFVGNVTDGQTGRRQSGNRQTDKQATDRQATSVLATGDLKIKLGFDCLCEVFPSSAGIGPFISIFSKYETVDNKGKERKVAGCA